jgi:hypothetical protein
LKIASVAFGKCREEYHYFFAPTSAGRSLRFCEKKRITRAKPAYRRQDAKAQRSDGRQALREEIRMPAAADRQGDVFLAVRILKL